MTKIGHPLLYYGTLLTLALIIGSCRTNVDTIVKASSYEINGTVVGFPDSTWLFLRNEQTKTEDSALVMQGKFTIHGGVPDSLRSAQAILHTKDFRDYKFLWIENAPLTFTGEMGKFRQSILKGSSTQDVSDEYDRTIAPFDKVRDSIHILLRNPDLSLMDREALRTQGDSIYAQTKYANSKFIRKNSASVVSTYILSVYCTSWGKDFVTPLYNALSEANKNSTKGKEIKRYITLNKNPKISEKMVDFEQGNTVNKKVKLSNFSGKVVLLEFWASWCGPCRQTNPELVKTYQKYKSKGFEILGVSLDDNKERWLQAIEKDGLPWENVSELNGDHNAAVLIYGVNAIPDNFLIDATGTILARNLRGEQLDNQLKLILK